MTEKKNDTPKVKMGRRPKAIFTESDIELIRNASGMLTVPQLVDLLGISIQTFYNMKAKDPEIEKAYAEGKSRMVLEMGNMLVQKAMQGDVTAMIFYLKTKGQWTEKETAAHGTVPPVNITFEVSPQKGDIKITRGSSDNDSRNNNN